jgi:hypothetical protein
MRTLLRCRLQYVEMRAARAPLATHAAPALGGNELNGKEIAKAVLEPLGIENSHQYLVPVMNLVEAERWLKEFDGFVKRYLIEALITALSFPVRSKDPC